ncbi:MAG: Lcl C-terminal domain-containing protein [Planctomycetota bacterium]
MSSHPEFGARAGGGCSDVPRDVDGTIDAKDGLPWTGSVPNLGALEYAESLALGGHTDWRLPNVRELMSLVDHSSAAHALDPLFGDAPVYFWSSTSLNSSPASAWCVGFQSGANGILGSTSKTQKHHVRAVRTATGR